VTQVSNIYIPKEKNDEQDGLGPRTWWSVSVKVLLRHFHRHCYKSSPLWFIVGGTKALVRSRQMNMRVYVVQATGA
jgi:hypothetical protein